MTLLPGNSAETALATSRPDDLRKGRVGSSSSHQQIIISQRIAQDRQAAEIVEQIGQLSIRIGCEWLGFARSSPFALPMVSGPPTLWSVQ